MSLSVGDWVLLPEGLVAEVTDISGEPAQVRASAAVGGTIIRPLVNAELRWRPLPEDGLRVRMALDPDGVRAQAENDPVAIVVAALRDDGGAASTAEVRDSAAIVFPEASDLRRWWKRTQPKLDDDLRVDASDSLQRRYRLLAPGGKQIDRVRPRRSGTLRNSLELLDGPTLLRARQTASSPAGLDDEARADLMVEAHLAADPSVDSTDRFLAGEVGLLVGEWSEDQLGRTMGEAVLDVDVMRVRDKASRERARSLAAAYLDAVPDLVPAGKVPVLASSAARGETSGAAAQHIAARLGIGATVVAGWGISWSAPGSVEAGAIDYPVDLQRYQRRLRQMLEGAAADASTQVGEYLTECLDALASIAGLAQKGDEWERTLAVVADAFWKAGIGRSIEVRSAVRAAAPMHEAAWFALVAGAPTQGLATMRQPLEQAYVASGRVLPAIREFCERSAIDEAAMLLWIARDLGRTTRLREIVVDAMQVTDADSTAHSDSVSLAGTVWPDHPDVIRELQLQDDAARRAIVAGDAARTTALLLTAGGWRAMVRELHELATSATSARDDALARRDTAEAKVIELEAALERRREAVQQVKTDQTREQTSNTSRLGISLFKPVAIALADSLESQSLAALQDRAGRHPRTGAYSAAGRHRRDGGLRPGSSYLGR